MVIAGRDRRAAMAACAASAEGADQCDVQCAGCLVRGSSRPVPARDRCAGQHDTKAAGEALAQLIAEKANPKYDVWYAGTGDATHLQAAEQDVTEAYQSPLLPQLHDWARTQAERSKYPHSRAIRRRARVWLQP